MPVQDLHETGHVRAFEIVRQIDVHVEIGDGVLFAAGAVLHLDRVIDVLDADFVDRNLTRVGMALHVLHGLHDWLLDGDGDIHNFFSRRYAPNLRGRGDPVRQARCASKRQNSRNDQAVPGGETANSNDIRRFGRIWLTAGRRPAAGHPTGGVGRAPRGHFGAARGAAVYIRRSTT